MLQDHEAAIVDPIQLVVKDVITTFMPCLKFLERKLNTHGSLAIRMGYK